jgi:hypothetical protein
VRTVRNAQLHSLGRMQSFGVLKQVVHIVTTGIQRVKMSFNSLLNVFDADASEFFLISLAYWTSSFYIKNDD